MPVHTDPQAYDIPSFCRAYSISRSFAYLEIKSGRLKPFKAGRRTLISRQAADDWRQSLEQVTNGTAQCRSPGLDRQP